MTCAPWSAAWRDESMSNQHGDGLPKGEAAMTRALRASVAFQTECGIAHGYRRAVTLPPHSVHP
jgi:hypothetical protein